MSKRNLFFFLLVAIAFLVATGIPTSSGNPGDEQEITVGRNVNMVAGTQLPEGDPWLQRQNEPSIAVSTRNPLHLLAGANDYRTVDWPIPGEEIPGFEKTNAARDAWLGVFKSFDGGQSWISTLLPGFPQDTSLEGTSSPLYGLTAAADPTVRAGTNGLFFYSGIAFDRVEHGRSAVFVASYIDNNNKEKGDSIKYLGTQIIAEGQGRKFIDKPWIAADIPRRKKPKIVMIDGQAIPKSNVYITYATFPGDMAEDIHSQVLFARSEDCGRNWFHPIKLSESQQINQGTTIAVDPGTGDIYVAWRRFGSEGESDAILATRSTDGGQKFSKAKKVTDITPFDQGTTLSSFRSNCFPTIAVDNGGIVYLAWSERSMGPSGEARIVIATSDNGARNWSTPKKIDSSIDEYEPGHQIMPSLTFADGKLMMIWYDQRDDTSGRFTAFIDDIPGQPRHTLDVRVSQAVPGIDPQFEPSKRVSRYLFILTGKKGNYNVQQIQHNFVNYKLFKQGTVPFIGDYIDITPSPVFILDESGKWRYNTDSMDSTVFHAAWTDNRDVRPPTDGLWTDYNPPHSVQEDPNFYTDNACTDWTKSGMRNQNIYTSRITEGIVFSSPGNTKPLGTLGETPEGEPIPRAFVVTVSNTTAEIRSFRLTIANQPPDAPPAGEGRASFLEFEFLDWMDVKAAPFSSVSRSVFVHSSDPKATVRVNVDEIYAPNGDIIIDGLASYVLLNPDIQNPDIQNPDIQNPDIQNPDIQNFEVHNPDIQNWYVNPDIMNPDIQNPDIMNPDIQNPDIMNPDIMNPDIQNPDIQNPDIMNPDIQNPDIMNPDIMNPDIMNPTISEPSAGQFIDVIWELQNIGNTTSSYVFRTLSSAADEDGNLPEGIQAQLLIYQVYSTPAEYDTEDNACELGKQEHHELILNIINPDIQNPDIQNMDFKTPDIQNPDIQNATFSLEPEGEAMVILRLWRPYDQTQTASRALSTRETLDFSNPDGLFESFGSFLSSEAGNTTDRQDGIPTFPSDSSFFMITTKVLDHGEVGEPYSDFLEAAGGEGDLTWSVTGLPGGLYLADSATGEIGGEPTTAGTFSFNAQVTDKESQIRTKDIWITISPPGAQVYTISGRVSFGGTGLQGVEMVGLPGNPITDSAGYYNDSVLSGWSGSVEPTKEEFTFDPPTKYYDSVDSNLATHYKAFDITPPIVTITDPATDKAVSNASYLVQGTASDIGSGLANVEVSIDNSTTWALATGTSSWTYSATLAPGANVIKARAADNSGNVSTPTTGITLTFDAISPTVAALTTPNHESYYNASTMPATFQGVAADDSGGNGLNANSTQFYIQNSDANYWDGSTWITGIQWLATSHAATSNGTQTNWTDAVNLPTWTDGIYYTRAKATDKAGNSYEGSEITFYYDSTGTFFLDHFEFSVIGEQIVGIPFNITITAKDSNGNTVETYTDTNTLGDTTGTISPTSTGTFLNGEWAGEVFITMASAGVTITASGGGKTGASNAFNVIVGAAGILRIENADDGTGTEVDTMTITPGGSFTVYAILRDSFDNFIANTSVIWELIPQTGDVGGGDLDTAEDEKSATFTGSGEGTAKIAVYYPSLYDETGTITVTGNPPDDSYEDNDEFGFAADIIAGTYSNLQLLDNDWYKIFVEENMVLKVSIAGVLEGNNIDLGLADSSGKYLVGGLSSSNEDTIYFNTTSAGYYYIRIPYTWEEGLQNTYSLTAEISESFGQGQVSGRVTSSTNDPLHVRVRVFDRYSYRKWNTLTDATTGEYRISMPPGSYKIRFITYPILDYYGGINYLSKYYDDAPRFVEAPLIEVLAGETTTDIDGQLEPAGAITGTVTDLQGNTIEGAFIRIRDLNGGSANSAYSDEFGQYTIERLNTGYFKAYVRSWTENHGIEWYNDKPSFNEANAVYVETGQTTSGIDFQLTDGGNVEGRVTDVNGGVGGIVVVAYDPIQIIPYLYPSGNIPRIGLRSTQTDENGDYFMDHLPNGNVSLYFNTDNTNHVAEWYDDALKFEDSVPVRIQAGQTTSGIDVELAESGSVGGRVTNSSGDGLKDVLVWIFHLEGGGYYQKNAYTNDDGWYRIDRIPVGNVKVRFRPNIYTSPYTGNWAVEWFADKNSYTAADEVTVLANETTWNTDAELAENGGTIEGRIINSVEQGIGGVYVTAYDSSIQAQVSYVYSNADGYYSIPRIPTCDVKLAFATGYNKLPYLSEFYSDQSSYDDATPVSVVLGETTFLPDVVLSDRPDLAVITDSLPDGDVGTPYSQALVADGGTKHYHWGLELSTLPDGLYLTSTGVIEGTPTAEGTFDFTVRVVDSSFPPQEAFSQNLSILINSYEGSGITISGNVIYDGSPLGGVFMEGLPDSTITNASGGYIAIVPSGWSGEITPFLPGYAFTPLFRSYDDVITNQINQDYTASVGLTLSGSVLSDGDGLPGVLMSGLPGNPTTDGNGFYAATIPIGWSGTVTPSKTGYTFDPSNRSYDSVASNQFGQDYDATFMVAEEWVASYDGPAANSNDDARAVTTDSSGNIYVTGSSGGSGTTDDILTIKYNSAGDKLWEARYNGPGSSGDYGSDIAVDSAGNVYVTGYGGWSLSTDYVTIKYDSNGDQVWVAKYNGPGNRQDYAEAIAVDLAGNVYVTGRSYVSTEEGVYYDYATVKYNSDGEEQWDAIYDEPENRQDRPTGIAVDSAGNAYVTGWTYGAATGYDYATIKYDSGTGSQVWEAIHDSGYSDQAYAIATDANDFVYVTGRSRRSETGYDYATIKYDSDGNKQWTTEWPDGVAWYDNDSNYEYPQALAIDPSGNVCVTGYSRVGGSNSDYATVMYDTNGVEQWAETYDGPENGDDMAHAVDVDSFGNVYVTGRSIGSNKYYEYATVKYDSGGIEQWVARYDGSANGNDLANDIVVDPSGDIVVTGSSHGSSTGDDYATIKYDSSGNPRWNTEGDGALRYNGPTNDEQLNWVYGDLMAMDSSDNVYISGYSYGDGTSLDFTTVKFDSSGDFQWDAQYNGPGNYWDYAENMVVDPSGNVYVIGTTYIDGINRDYATVKYNSDGVEEWTATYNGPANGNDWGLAIAVDASGDVYVTGYSDGGITDYDCTTIKYNGDTGEKVGIVTYNNSEGWGITVDPSGNVYVTGQTYTGPTKRYDILTIKYDSNLAEKWVRAYNGEDYDYGYFIALDSSNNVYVGGEILNDYAVVKYNNAGDFQWVATYDGPANGNEMPLCLEVDPEGNAYVTGMSDGTDMSRDNATVKYDSFGAEVWVRRYAGENEGSYDYGSDIAIDSSGNVYVVGRSGGSSTSYDSDCITMKYDSEGDLLWMMRYNRPGNKVDGGHSISVTSSGDVYVAGLTDGPGTGRDFLAIKYSQLQMDNATITGTIRYNGEPLSNKTQTQNVNFWLTGDPPVTPVYNNQTGQYSIPDIPPGTYQINVYVDAAAPFDGQIYPGDYRAWTNNFTVSEGDSVITIDIDLRGKMHLTSPFDNSTPYGNYGDFTNHTHTSPVSFQWDSVPEASKYGYYVEKIQIDPFDRETIIQQTKTSNLQVSLSLPPSGSNDYYVLGLWAENANNEIIADTWIVLSPGGFSTVYEFKVFGQVDLTGPTM